MRGEKETRTGWSEHGSKTKVEVDKVYLYSIWALFLFCFLIKDGCLLLNGNKKYSLRVKCFCPLTLSKTLNL